MQPMACSNTPPGVPNRLNTAAKKIAIPPLTGVDNALSAGTVKLGRLHEALLSQRPVTGLAFCPGPSPLLLASYSMIGAQLGAEAHLKVRSMIFALSHINSCGDGIGVMAQGDHLKRYIGQCCPDRPLPVTLQYGL